MKADLKVVGPQAVLNRRIAASATRYEVGEPLHGLGTLTSGVDSTNTFVLAAADTPVIGTHKFGGIAVSRCLPIASGTVVAHTAKAACPVPYIGQVRGRAETVTAADTQTELTGLMGDVVLIDYNATGGADGGELYTIKDAASADTSGLEIVGGNPAISELWVTVAAQAYRHDVS